MVFACCFGGGGVDVDVQPKPNSYGGSVEQRIIGKTGKAEDFSELPKGGEAGRTATTCLTGNTASLSAVTSTDSSSVAYQLNNLCSALASLSGNWYERVSSAATRIANVSGAALCSVSILDAAHDKFTVVHVIGKDPNCASISPIGSQLPALQAAASTALHQPMASGAPELRYNSVQVLQLLQTPLLYSFSDPNIGSGEMKQPPYDWQALFGTRGLSDFCALPLMHDKSVVGAVTVVFSPSPPEVPTGAATGRPPAPPSGTMCRDEQSLRAMGLLLSVLLTGPDLRLGQQVAEILADVHAARNLQQLVTAMTAGAERVLQLKTRVAVSVTLALLPCAALAGAAAGGGSGGPPAGSNSGDSAASGASGGGGTRAIFFEEFGSTSLSGVGGGGGLLARSLPEARQRSQGSFGNHQGHRGKLPRSNAQPSEASSSFGAAAGGSGGASGHGASPLGRAGGGGGISTAPPGVRVPGMGVISSTHEGLSGVVNGSQGALLWQASLVQARAVGLRHTLLANLPSAGTVVHDCASYMQQVGCPKRDLYLLSTCNGTPPFSLVIAPAPMPLVRAGFCDGGAGAQFVLYVAVATRLPQELLNELLSQAQQLAVKVLAPLLGQKLAHGGLAEEWALLLGKCAAASRGGGAGGALEVQGSGSAAIVNGTAAVAAEGGDGGGGRASAAGCGGNGAPPPSPTAAKAGSSGGVGSTALWQGGKAPLPSRGGGGEAGGNSAPAAAAAMGSLADAGTGPSRALSAMDTSRESQATVLSTAVAGAFKGDTRTHMGMLVASFKDTINALQAFRADEAEELSVLKLGKVLGRGGSGLVFQGYLHMGLEVAVKLFENPDDADPDAGSSSEHDGVARTALAAHLSLESAGGGDGAGGASDGGGGGGEAAVRRTPSKTATQQMTKRQRDLLRNALELGVTSSLSHPNIVQGYCHWVNVVLMQDASLNRCWLMGQNEYGALALPGSPPPPLCSALVMEYCDMGSLIHALKRGTFTTPDGKPNMEYVYMCLLEIALALRHLHTAKLAHCDLKPGNVLLRSSPRDPRGFVCKLGDFGYAAILKDGLLPGRPAVLPEEACGTLQYMAPELFVAGRPVDASIDVYAFGMLMWELVTGRTPYSESDHPSRSLMKAVYHGKRPTFPETTLASYKNLAMCCWSGDPNMRPSASVLVKLLRQQLEALKQQHSSSASSNSTSSANANSNNPANAAVHKAS